ncbi:MAG TPA: amidinotransferase, partial [Nocardioides sp.]|nr:amidinotransferase [Nocardioides sp.]
MPLSWGRHYVMVEPTHFRIDYVINPFMDPDEQPDRELALAQWRTLVETIERLGGTVDVIPQRPDAPDMVFAMNLGLAVARRRGDGGLEPHAVMSH